MEKWGKWICMQIACQFRLILILTNIHTVVRIKQAGVLSVMIEEHFCTASPFREES